MKRIVFILLGLLAACFLLMGGIHVVSCQNDNNVSEGDSQQSEEGDKDFTLPEIDFNSIQESGLKNKNARDKNE